MKAYVLQLTRSTYKCLTCEEGIKSKRAAMKHECKPIVCEHCGVVRGSGTPWGEGIDDDTQLCRSCEQAFIDECESENAATDGDL